MLSSFVKSIFISLTPTEKQKSEADIPRSASAYCQP